MWWKLSLNVMEPLPVYKDAGNAHWIAQENVLQAEYIQTINIWLYIYDI